MRIVRAEGRHLDGITKIERASFPDPWSRESISYYLDAPDGETLALEDGGVVAGFAIYHVSFEEAELYNIAVRPDFRRRGAGRALLAAVLERARAKGAERMFLEVRKSNAAAVELYRSAGFSVCGERRGYYENPREDAVLMDMELGERK